jgi:hypothetical protein
MLCPTAPSLPWVPWASVPHLPRYDAPRRLPPAPLGALRLSLASPIPCLLPLFVGSLTGSWPGGKPPHHARACGHSVPPSGDVITETGGSPTFPSSPSDDLPRSQPPVVSSIRAKTHPGLRPSVRRLHTVGFPLKTSLRDILVTTTRHIAGLNHAACLLATPGSVRPLTGRHAGSLLTGWRGVGQGGRAP